MESEEHRAVTVFRDYLRIKSVYPDPDYAGIVKFLTNYAEVNGFSCRVIDVAPDRPIVVITVEGSNPSLPSILLNSHTDVVPVFEESWTYPPFSATKTENGDIYARGSQDMKCVGIQHLEAMRELKSQGVKLLRTVHLSFVPDEEIGGTLGMKLWVNTDDFKSMNVGFALDEGLANPDEEMRVFYSERVVRWANFKAEGRPGHGSQFLPNTAGYKVQKIINKILEFRDQQEARLKADPSLTIGDVSTINITSLKGGVQPNVVPSELGVGCDLRITPNEVAETDSLLERWATECDVTLEFIQKQVEYGITSIDTEDEWWSAFSSALNKHDARVMTEIFPAATDSRYLRHVGIPALGFSPMNNTPILLHDHNEFLNEKVFLAGIPIFVDIIQSVANVSA